MKKMLIGFAIGVAFTCLCGFSMGRYSAASISTFSSSSMQANFDKVLENQYKIARMLEDASCR